MEQHNRAHGAHDLQDELFASARLGETGFDRLQAALDAGADASARDPHGRSPLHYAAMAASEAACGLLVTHGADVNALDEDGQEALAFAVLRDSNRCAKFLLDLGADPNCRDVWGSPMLHVAVCAGASKADLMDDLIAAGADVALRDRNGLEPIHWAAVMGMTDTARQLVKLGANPAARDALGRAPWETCGYDDDGLRDAFRSMAAPVAKAPAAKTREPALAAG